MASPAEPVRRSSPHIGSYRGELVDYNGVGIWSADAIQERYKKHAQAIGMNPATLSPKRHEENGRVWIYPLMEQVIGAIEGGDKAAIEIGIEFLQEDDHFVFGKILKSNTARALRRAPLTQEQKTRIRERLVDMLLQGNVPHEWHEYKKLLRAVGLGQFWPKLDHGINRENRYVMRYYDYLDRYARLSAK